MRQEPLNGRNQQEKCAYDEVLDLIKMVPTYELGSITSNNKPH